MFQTKNIVAALEMYYQRLQYLKKEVSHVVFRAEAGEGEELEAKLKISIIEAEVNHIHKCLGIVEVLLERCEDGNL